VIDALLGTAYSLTGFVVGFLLGRVTREVHEIKETVVPETFAQEDAYHHTRATRLGIVVIILSLVTVVSSAMSTVAVYRQADCLREYNSRFTLAFNARATANDTDRKALNTMIVSIADRSLSQQERAAKFAAYVEQVKAGDRLRAEHPLPQPPDPRRLCGQ